jgi:hypothetical protein
MKTYFCYLNYFATGEGMTNAMAVSYAENKEAAKKAFCIKHLCNNDATNMLCISYFSHGVVVYDMNDETQHAKIKNIMKDFFTENNIEYMFHANKAGALIDFYYKSYANYS